MKLNKLIFSLALVSAASLATPGCKKGSSGYTPLPGAHPEVGSGPEGAGTLPPSQPFGQGDQNPMITGQPIPPTTSWDPVNMNQDRTILAAYTVHFPFD